MATPLADLATVKSQLNITTTARDATITGFLEVATELIENEVGPVTPRSCVETVPLSPTIVLSRAPVITVDALTPVYPSDSAFYNSGYTFNVSDYLLDPVKGILRRIPKYGYAGNYGGVSYPGFGYSGLITVTYTAGMSVVPSALRQAAVLIVRELLQEERGAMPMPAMGGDQEDMPASGGNIPRIIAELVAPRRRGARIA